MNDHDYKRPPTESEYLDAVARLEQCEEKYERLKHEHMKIKAALRELSRPDPDE